MFLNSNYNLIHIIGEGGMGEVWLAEHKLLKCNVAIKVLKREFANNLNVRKRFLSEARNLFRMNHMHIVKVTDFIEQDENVAIVMELIEGETLKEHIVKKHKLSYFEIEKLFKQMLESVKYIHDFQLVHRDIKPSNFMIDSNANIKLMDFGIAKNLDSKSAEYTMTAQNQQIGTPIYMSPEQIKSSSEVTHFTDIYSLGVVLWQMVQGISPYDTEKNSIWEIQYKITTEKISLTNSDFDWIIQSCTEIDSSKRPTNCGEILEMFSNKHKGQIEDLNFISELPPPPPILPKKRIKIL